MTKGQDTKERILGEALDLASTVGIEGLSIGELAKATEMSKSGLFAHFNSKEDLQLEVLRSGSANFIETVVSPALRQPRGEPRVRALFERWLAWETLRTGGCPFMAATFELDDRPGPVRDALVATQQDWVRYPDHCDQNCDRRRTFQKGPRREPVRVRDLWGFSWPFISTTDCCESRKHTAARWMPSSNS